MKCPVHSLLFVPGHRPDRFAKAAASGAHQIVLDLEDAVAPDAKALARDAVATWLAGDNAGVVRINGADTIWFEDDLKMIREFAQAEVMLPKADAASVAHTASALAGRPVIALLETVAGYMELAPMSRSPDVCRVAFGSIDFALDSGIADEGAGMTAIRTQIVLHSRAAGLAAPIDGVSVDFSDKARMHADALCSQRLGFGGKLCIHPSQVAAINRAFAPSDQEVAWAQCVLSAFESSGGAAIAVDGKMIDLPVVERARRIVGASGTGSAL
jgi:citrate lyase subunit beta/citryl-CoA lyase